MNILSEQQFERCRTFLQTQARVLDMQLATFYFWGGSANDVREALKQFQNSDGGFGHSIEPDFRLEQSSPMGTSIGLQYARDIGLPVSDPIIQLAIKYLLDNYDPKEQRWHAVPEAINHVPHAPWWSFDVTTGRCGVEETWANPNAEILGYFWQYKDLVPAQFLQTLTDKAILELDHLAEKLSLHDFLCYQRLLKFLPEPYRAVVMNKLLKSLMLTVDPSPEQWSNYGSKPLQVAASPASPFADSLRKSLLVNLDYEIEHINDDGSWSPNWSWYGNYDQDWAYAETEWKGYLTVKNLKSLHDFERIELTR